MDIKQKTAAIATFANVVLTVIKFVSYAFTGSLAILSEAWHSLSDIATSFLVWLALRRKSRLTAAGWEGPDLVSGRLEGSAGDATGVSSSGEGSAPDILPDILPDIPPDIPPDVPSGASVEGTENGSARSAGPGESAGYGLCPEETASLVIGFILLAVSVSLFHSILYSVTKPLTNTLTTGILFFVFGISSFLVYRFETQIGLEEHSVGLTSDGLHSKSDMLASFLAGSSLISYHFGFDFDRGVGFFIALLIFSLAIEVFYLVFSRRFRAIAEKNGTSPELPEFKTHKIMVALLEPETWQWARRELEERFDLQFRDIPGLGFLYRHGSTLLILLLVALYLSTSFFTVNTTEVALVERMGELQNNRRPYSPGLHVKLPWPFDTAIKIQTSAIQAMEVGIRVTSPEKALIWSREHGDGEPFLSGDNNFIYPYLTVFYRIEDPVRFFMLHSAPETFLQESCLRVMTETFSRQPLYALIAHRRREVLGELGKSLQSRLDAMETGIRVVEVCLKDIHPPVTVTSAFEAVVAAEQEKQTMILEAFSFRNTQIPDIRGESETIVRKAEIYSLSLKHQANGESQRFRMTENTFQATRDVTRLRLYLYAMENTLKLTRLVLVDRKSGYPGMYINSEKLPGFGFGGETGPFEPSLPGLPDVAPRDTESSGSFEGESP